MWPDKALGERIDKDFIAIKLDGDKKENKTYMEKFGVEGYPTFVVADGKEKILAKQVGAPFNTVAQATKWFDTVTTAISQLPAAEKAHDDKPEDAAASEKLCVLYMKLGRHAEVATICEIMLRALPEGDKRTIVFRFYTAKIDSENWEDQDKPKAAAETFAEILPALIAAKDERAIDAAISGGRYICYMDNMAKGLLMLVKTIAAFPAHDDVTKLCTFVASMSESYDTLSAAELGDFKKQLEAIVKTGPADCEGALYAKAILKTLSKGDKKPVK